MALGGRCRRTRLPTVTLVPTLTGSRVGTGICATTYSPAGIGRTTVDVVREPVVRGGIFLTPALAELASAFYPYGKV